MKQKRVVAIHDISCMGKCSLTVALPILSAAGHEVSVIPTAILSTHTGGFTGYTYRDLTNDIEPIVEHWEKQNVEVDAIYTGYLGSFMQLEIVSRLIKKLKKENTVIIIDPVMGDNGKLYSSFTNEFVQGMKKFCENADIIVPNITEATFILNKEYTKPPYTRGFIEELLHELSYLGAKKIILTGVSFTDESVGCAVYDSLTKEISYIFSKKVEGYYHGTGDVFASSLVGALISGVDTSKSAALAVDFTYESILRTKKAGTDTRFGVNFEEGLFDYAGAIMHMKG